MSFDLYRYFIGAKNKIIIIYTIVNLYDCCIRYKLFTVRSSSMLVESNVNCLQYWQVICLLNQVWIAHSKFVKFYAYWIRYELFTVLSSCVLVKSAVNCLQHCQVLWLLNKMWIIYSIVKFYGCWINVNYLQYCQVIWLLNQMWIFTTVASQSFVLLFSLLAIYFLIIADTSTVQFITIFPSPIKHCES